MSAWQHVHNDNAGMLSYRREGSQVCDRSVRLHLNICEREATEYF